MIKSYLLDELDKILASVGVIFSLILFLLIKLVVDYTTYVMIGILCFMIFMICIGYLTIRKFFHPSLIYYLDELRGSTRFYITLNILFFVLFSYSIVSIYLRSDHYIRPLGYFISTTLMAVIVANEILFLSHQKSHIYFVLCKIIIIGLSLQYSQLLIFPNVVGVDPWAHQWLTLEIIDNGHIYIGSSYSKLPMMHLMIGMTSLVTGLGYKMATMVSIGFLQVFCDALFVFLLGSFLISTKVGLLAALLLELANFHIHFGYWTVPNTLAATLILPIIFILFKLRRARPFIGNLLALLLMGSLILTHTITTMYLAILLFAFWAVSKAYSKLFHEEKILQSVTLNTSILFSIGMLAYWTYASGHIRTLANLIKWGFRIDLFKTGYESLYGLPLWEQIFKYIGLFLFFILSLIGCLYITSKQFRNENRFSTIIGGIVVLCLAFFSFIFNKTIFLGRWFYYLQIFMAIPLSLSLILISGIFKNHLIKGLLMSISVFTLSFLLIMSPTANMDNRFFNPNSGIRKAFTESELNGMDTISRIWNGTIGSDWYSHDPIIYQLNAKFISIDKSLHTGNFSDMQETLIIIRDEILNKSFITDSGIFILDEDPCIALYEQNFSRIYDCGSLFAYVK